ncbi:MAG: cytochrome c5 family protein [Candidatus Competibacteraceae bacterium]|nr:cytochrome c5 family protein [Candidatus Competibacteraceae bacterium]
MVAALMGVVNSVAPDDGLRKQSSVLERIKPVARVSFEQPKPAIAVKLSGQEVYNKVCAACHAVGVLNAPKVGAKDQWDPRVAQGLDTLVTHAVTGIRAMPAKGGNPALTEANIRGPSSICWAKPASRPKPLRSLPTRRNSPSSLRIITLSGPSSGVAFRFSSEPYAHAPRSPLRRISSTATP